MRAPPSAAELERFGGVLVDVMGMHFDESKYGELGKVLHSRLQASGLDYAAYLHLLATPPGKEEIGNLARELTVTETYFLRNAEQFKALVNVALPARAAGVGGTRPLNILSAGCASGEEPYSLAIAVRENLPQLAGSVSITAFDLNPAMLQKAARARYGNWSLRACPEESKTRWFTADGDSYQLAQSIRATVGFEARNLAVDAPDFWRAGRFDIIFCRNILMYFSPAQAQAAIARMAGALAPDGYLFLGHAETLRGLSNDFHLCHTHDAFYYRRKEILGGAETLPEPATTHPWRPTGLAPDDGWFETIHRAAERIHALLPPNGAAHAETHSAAIEDGDPDALLLKAVAASHDGNLDAAEESCRALLQRDEMSAGAHYVLALCSEGRGDIERAIDHDRIAAYLAPDFAMPRLHAGLLARRRGERQDARAELEAALPLLQREDPSRVLLFGGGFKRDALVALCRAELHALGERT